MAYLWLSRVLRFCLIKIESVRYLSYFRKFWDIKKYGVDDSWVSFRLPHLNKPGSTYMSWVIEKGEVKNSRRDNVGDCGQACCYIESLVPPISENKWLN